LPPVSKSYSCPASLLGRASSRSNAYPTYEPWPKETNPAHYLGRLGSSP
jgi:hypothetical protein